MSLENTTNKEAKKLKVSGKKTKTKHDEIVGLYVNALSIGDYREVHEEVIEGHPLEWLYEAVEKVAKKGDKSRNESIQHYLTVNKSTYLALQIERQTA